MEMVKRECILVAAAKAFSRFGFRKTSVEEIAKEAGVAKGTVYLACESKEDLMYQAVHREVRAWIAEVSKLIDPRVRADELLTRVAQAATTGLDERPLVRDLVVGVLNGQLPGWADRLEGLRALGRANVEEVLRLGIRQNLFRADLDVEEVARLLQDLHYATYLFTVQTQGDTTRLQRRAAAGFSLVLDGLRVRPASASAG